MVGNGSIPATGVNRSLVSYCRTNRRTAEVTGDIPVRKGWKDVRPFDSFLMFAEKDIFLTLTFSSIVCESSSSATIPT